MFVNGFLARQIRLQIRVGDKRKLFLVYYYIFGTLYRCLSTAIFIIITRVDDDDDVRDRDVHASGE